jgi:predicted acetyltransferase
MNIELIEPHLDQKQLFKNMFLFYRYDLLPFQSDGSGLNKYGVIDDHDLQTHDASIQNLDEWWDSPSSLFPLIIEADGNPAGFIFVASNPFAHPDVDYRLNDFYILNSCRKKGIGEKAANLLFEHRPGNWELGWLEANVIVAKFWERILSSKARNVKSWDYYDGEKNSSGNRIFIPGLYFEID